MSLFFIIGKAQHGKTTFGNYLAQDLGLEAADTSSVVVEVETARQKALGIDGLNATWDTVRERPNRQHLVATGDALQRISPTIFVDALVARRKKVIIGIRRDREWAEAAWKYRDQDVITIEVSRPRWPTDPNDNYDVRSRPGFVKVCMESVEGLQAAAAVVAQNYLRGAYGPA